MHTVWLLLAKDLVYIIVLIAFVYWLTLPRPLKVHLAVFGVIAAVVSLILMVIGSSLYYDPRPFVTHHVTPLIPHAPDNGFPSDHALLAAFTALTVFWQSRRLGIALLILAVLVGLARVVGHIHSPIDIIGSFVFAGVGAGIAAWLTPRLIARFTGK